MWNRRKDDENPPKQIIPPTAPPANPTRDVSLGLPRVPESGSASIGKAVMVKGQIVSREDLTIDGEVEGTVDAPEHRVTVGPNGKIHAGVRAREVVVLGVIHGNVEAMDKIDIRKDARLVGDIRTTRIVIEDGAYFKGSIDIAKSEPKPEPKPQAQARPAVPPPQLPQAVSASAVVAADKK